MPRKSREDPATELMLALGQLVRRVRSAATQASHELSWAQMAVMARIDREGPATTADLARAEGVKPQSIGATLAGLEEMGVVERRPHPTDGRQVIIALTAKGREVRKEAGMAKRIWLAQAIAKLDAREQEAIPAVTALIKHLGES